MNHKFFSIEKFRFFQPIAFCAINAAAHWAPIAALSMWIQNRAKHTTKLSNATSTKLVRTRPFPFWPNERFKIILFFAFVAGDKIERGCLSETKSCSNENKCLTCKGQGCNYFMANDTQVPLDSSATSMAVPSILIAMLALIAAKLRWCVAFFLSSILFFWLNYHFARPLHLFSEK